MSQAAYDYAAASERARKTLPQLDDPHVSALADRDHVPHEIWSVSGDLIALTCETCANPWPCPTRQALRAMETKP